MSGTFRKIVVERLGTEFRKVTRVVETPRLAPRPGEVELRVAYCGVNASDVNFTAGAYLPGVVPPFDAGFEALGVIERVGEGVDQFQIGQPAAAMQFGAFAEFLNVRASHLVPLPRVDVKFLPLLVSGLTASIALAEVGEMRSGQVVCVTAAAGGTGQFAVQLAKLNGNHVIGTTSSAEKAEFLRSLGCDRVVNYKQEDLGAVLKTEYPKGVDVVYESVGGPMFDACASNLARHGKLIVIGMISGYEDGSAWVDGGKSKTPLAVKLLRKSASVRGFFLNDFSHKVPEHMASLVQLVEEGKLKSHVSEGHHGLDAVADAVDHMFAGRNMGKVVVTLDGSVARL